MLTNICKVMQRLSTGDSIVCTTKAVDRPFDINDYNTLSSKISNTFSKESDDILYFTIRAIVNGNKKNWKVTTFSELNKTLKEIFDIA